MLSTMYAHEQHTMNCTINRAYARKLLSIIKENKTKIVYNTFDKLLKFLCCAEFYVTRTDNDKFALSIFIELEKLDNDYEYYDDYVI